MHIYATLEETVYLFFGSNDTSGSGADGATPVYDVRLGGAAADAAPTLSGNATLLTHANYPPGAHEVAIAATAANGFAAGNTYGVFCTLLVDSQNPTGFVGSFKLAPVPANVAQWLGAAAHAATVNGVPVVQLHDSAGAGGINAPANFEDLAIVDTAGTVAVPTTQKVDVETIKTKAVAVDASGTTFPAGTLASTTNITGGVITTVTTLTNAPADSAGVTEILTRIPDATAGAVGGLVICGTNAAITITSAAGNALTLASTGANGHGLACSGNGSGDGVNVIAGASGNGIVAQGGSTAGAGLVCQANQATGAGCGIAAYGFGTSGWGIHALAGLGGNAGIYAAARGNNGAGLECVKHGAGKDIDADELLTAAQIESECNDALVVLHLDHLLAVDYDPAAKPGVATALLNELVESDGGVSRFTVNALENGPSGSGASAEAIADAVWDELSTGHTSAGKAGQQLWTDVDAILEDTGTTIPAQITALNNLSAAQVNAEVVDCLQTDTPIDGKTIQSALRIIAAGVLGKVSGAGMGIEIFLGLDGATVRATVTVDEDGNRSAVVYA